VENMEDRDGRLLQIAPGSGHFVRIALPPSANEQSLLARYI